MKRAGLAIVAAAMVVAGSGCAKSSSTTTSAGGAAKVPAFARGFKPPTSGCGSYPIRQPADPDGVIAALDAQHRAALGGYADFPGSTVKVVKSRWANWKPAHPGPYKVAVSWGQLVSDFQVQIVDNLKKDLGQTPGVGTVDVRTTGNNLDIAQQLQQYQSLVQVKPDLIILETPSPDSFYGPVQKAAAAGHPDGDAAQPGAGGRRGECRRQQLPRACRGGLVCGQGDGRQGQRATRPRAGRGRASTRRSASPGSAR